MQIALRMVILMLIETMKCAKLGDFLSQLKLNNFNAFVFDYVELIRNIILSINKVCLTGFNI